MKFFCLKNGNVNMDVENHNFQNVPTPGFNSFAVLVEVI